LCRLPGLPASESPANSDDGIVGAELSGKAAANGIHPAVLYGKELSEAGVRHTVANASERCQGLKMSEFERQQLKLLCRQLGLLPDGTQDAAAHGARRLAA
jgi:hypothetical protein